MRSVQVEPIIRAGLRKYTDVIGQLWCSLASYYIRLGQFEKVSIVAHTWLMCGSHLYIRLVTCTRRPSRPCTLCEISLRFVVNVVVMLL